MAKDINITAFSNEDIDFDFYFRQPDPDKVVADGKSYTLDNTLPIPLPDGYDIQAVIFNAKPNPEVVLKTYLMSDNEQFRMIDPEIPSFGFRIPQEEALTLIQPKNQLYRYRLVLIGPGIAKDRIWGGAFTVSVEP